MKFSRVFKWVWPAAIVSGLFMVLSDLLGLTTYLPGIKESAPTGFHAVGTGMILWVMILLLIGMIGFVVRGRVPGNGARVIEYGDGKARYVLAELYQEWESYEGAEFEDPTTTTRRASRSPVEASLPRRSRQRSRQRA